MGSSGCRAEPRHAGDGCQRPLVPRSRFQPRLMPSVRPCGREANPQDREAHRPPHDRNWPRPRRSQPDDRAGQDRRPSQASQTTKTGPAR